MEFSSIKAGDTIRVTTAARTQKGFGGKTREIPAQTLTVRVNAINAAQADCVVLVTADGEVLPEPGKLFVSGPAHLQAQRFADQRPTVVLFRDTAGQTFERA